jgi:MoaA/NifB/PqqE/SkfB family radical SAM enzyme
MQFLQKKGIPFGVSITVTNENYITVTESGFADDLERRGCKAVLFVEYVPFESPELALGDTERADLAARIDALRARERDMIMISFPGDEAGSGGCLAAGRGFFHISASGAAEPCPFSPYSDMNLRDVSVREALKSPLFARLSAEEILSASHRGGCVLFEQQEAVASMVSERRQSAK